MNFDQVSPLCICSAPADFKGDSVCSELSGYPYRVPRRVIEVNLSSSSSAPSAPPAETTKPTAATAAATAGEKEKFKEKFRTHRVAADTVDHYEALGLAHMRWTATPAQIRTAFRRMSLQYHPDKLTGSGEDDSVFKRIAKAYEVLSDPQKRREYDSQDVFDDRIPTEQEADSASASSSPEEAFFALFTTVFDRNSRFSVGKPVPRLGDLSTPFAEVERFYRFWHEFRTWREFPLEDAYDPEEAGSREERRWIERQNEKRKAKRKAEESARITRLVDLAERRDPRIARKKEEERAARELKRAAKREEAERRARKELEEAQAAQRAAEEVAEREKAAKLAAAKEKARRHAILARFLGRHEHEIGGDMATKAEVIEGSPEPHMQRSIAAIEACEPGGDESKAVVAVKAELAAIGEHARHRAEELAAEEREKRQKAAAEAAAKAARPLWSEAELSMLARAVRKFPPGIHERWEKISAMIGTRSPEEVVAKTQEVKRKDATSIAASRDDPYAKMKEKVQTRPIDSPLDIAWDRVNAGDQAAKPAAAASAPAPAATAASGTKKASDIWTAEQQKKLEEGLRAHKTDEKDRWERIAEIVPGKTKEECLARFKFLKESLSKKPAAAKAPPTQKPAPKK